MRTVAPAAPRLTWVEPCVVVFGHDGKGNRTISFGPPRFGEHNVTVNGVEGRMASFVWRQDGAAWRFVSGEIRVNDGSMNRLSDAAHRKVRDALELLVPRMAERCVEAFGSAQQNAAAERAVTARRHRNRLLATANGLGDIAAVNDMVASGEAEVRRCADRRCRVDSAFAPGNERHVVAEIFANGGRIGWAVTSRRNWATSDLQYIPEHLVELIR